MHTLQRTCYGADDKSSTWPENRPALGVIAHRMRDSRQREQYRLRVPEVPKYEYVYAQQFCARPAYDTAELLCALQATAAYRFVPPIREGCQMTHSHRVACASGLIRLDSILIPVRLSIQLLVAYCGACRKPAQILNMISAAFFFADYGVIPNLDGASAIGKLRETL